MYNNAQSVSTYRQSAQRHTFSEENNPNHHTIQDKAGKQHITVQKNVQLLINLSDFSTNMTQQQRSVHTFLKRFLQSLNFPRDA